MAQNVNLSFGELYDQHVRRVYDYIYYKTLHKETAEDLTSQTFMKALKKFQQYDAAKGSFSAWVYRIARNTVYDHFRALRPTSDIVDVWDLASDDNIERDADVQLQLEEIQSHLIKLKAEQREVILMRVWGGLTYAEIAVALGKTEAGCKMLFARGIKQLRASMPLALFLVFITSHLYVK